MSKNKNKPDVISLTSDEVDALKARIRSHSLTEDDRELLTGVITWMLWLQTQLARSKLTILRLKKLFGFSTEKSPKKKDSGTEENKDEPEGSGSNNNNQSNHSASSNKKPPVWNEAANHGRYSADDYEGCETITLQHETLKKGDACPNCIEAGANGKLYESTPGKLIRLVGNAIITGRRYIIEKLRCNLCGDRFNATVPSSIEEAPKYDNSCRSTLAISRYGMGLPFKRIETYQAIQHIPVADATQWDLTVELYQDAEPVIDALATVSSEGDLHYFDDTPNRILSESTAIHTTAMITEYAGHEVHLFITSSLSGVSAILPILEDHDNNFISMSDASPANYAKKVPIELCAKWILCFCLVHGRRKFFELLKIFPEACQFVISQIGLVYCNERHCKQQGLSAEQRLAYHQQYSKPIMDALYGWMMNQYLYPSQRNAIEPNSGLGEAIGYMLRHWLALTRFLYVAGAPLDNSLCEQTIKVVIRHRRNSLFFKTPFGAQVGDGLMSLIQTAIRNDVNPMDYLNALQAHAAQVIIAPRAWLPWCYKETLASHLKKAA